jgi:antirestriction protein ArdC
VPVVFWKVYTTEDHDTGDEEKRFVLRQYTVFNAAQLDGLAVPEIPVTPHRVVVYLHPADKYPRW